VVKREKIRLSDESGFFMFLVTYEGFISGPFICIPGLFTGDTMQDFLEELQPSFVVFQQM